MNQIFQHVTDLIILLDLTFVTKELNNMFINWEINEDKVTDSDHEIILFSINIDSGNLVENPVYNSQYNFEKADWKIFAEELILQSNKEEFASNINITQISKEMLETEEEKLKDIFKAFNYTKFNRIEKLSIIQYQHENQKITAITFEQKCEAFMQVLFKKPPQSEVVDWNNYIEKDWE